MATLKINGKSYEADGEKKLLGFIRDDLHLTGTKDGCSEGACGTCTVIVDGKATKACVQTCSKFDGKEIVTIEGLTQREKDVYTYAFGKAGSVQCGFCIPGMVLSGKALLDVNPNPTRKEVASAIKGNICRCTGYHKIIDGILLAAKVFREEEKISNETITGVGQRAVRIDASEKILGEGKYTDDLYFEGMLYGSVVRSKYPRAKILSINTKKAKALDGVRAVLTSEDIPGKNKIGHIKKDWDTLIPVGAITAYLGDAIVAVAADTPEILEKAKSLVEIEYEKLDGVFSPLDALKEDAPLVHPTGNMVAHEMIKRGDVNTAIKNAAYVVTQKYFTPPTEHAFLEPECAVAIVDKEKRSAYIYSSDQGTHQTARECSEMLGFEKDEVHVKNLHVGGGFGGKEDMSVQHHAALLSYYTGKPVKIKLTRQESLLVHPKRHEMHMEFTTACDENGILTALKASLISDTGAYASLAGPVLQRACTHASGPYNYHNIEIDGKAVYTNNPPAGAFRGFGVTQSCFAIESSLNLLAEKVGISPWEIRYKNALKAGDEMPNGQIAMQSTALKDTLEAVKDFYESEPYAGIACAMKNAGLGVGLPDWGRCKLTVENGKVHIRAGASDIGQGLGTTLVQFACEATRLTGDDFIYETAETVLAPDSGDSSGSRQTLITGEATVRAAKELKKDLDSGKTLDELNGKEYYGEYLAKTDPMGSDKKNPVSHVAYGFATHVVALNEDGTIKKVVAAHDVGRSVNPLSTEGQIEGGVVMSLGYALTENFPTENGKPKAKYGTLGLFRSDKTPPIESIIIEKNKSELAYGAIGIGEIVSIPTAPAVQGAYYKLDKKFRTSLPLEHTAYKK